MCSLQILLSVQCVFYIWVRVGHSLAPLLCWRWLHTGTEVQREDRACVQRAGGRDRVAQTRFDTCTCTCTCTCYMLCMYIMYDLRSTVARSHLVSVWHTGGYTTRARYRWCAAGCCTGTVGSIALLRRTVARYILYIGIPVVHRALHVYTCASDDTRAHMSVRSRDLCEPSDASRARTTQAVSCAR